jgi:dTDP-4-amino-4,6-dideoxygalactose transaminase
MLIFKCFKDTCLKFAHAPSYAQPASYLIVGHYLNRDRLQVLLYKIGFYTIVHYLIPTGNQNAYAIFKSSRLSEFPQFNIAVSENLSLPIGPHLNQSRAKQVVQIIQNALSILFSKTVKIKAINLKYLRGKNGRS